jgi:hypothetical protein
LARIAPSNGSVPAMAAVDLGILILLEELVRMTAGDSRKVLKVTTVR